MPDAQEVQSVLDAAERAASTGDYAAAERLLREAASHQESVLGSQHPDLANTFNNLGIVCELTEEMPIPGGLATCFQELPSQCRIRVCRLALVVV